jgi:hypothetical protein
MTRTRRFRWRMAKPCTNCPFNASGPGLRLRKSLRPGRWREITDGLRRGQEHFTCHKTGPDTGNDTNLVCAGSIAYQARLGVTSNLFRVMSRVEALVKSGRVARKSAIFPR